MANKAKTFQDLANAIYNVLSEAAETPHDEGNGINFCYVHKDSLRILQEEYNIHFVEPNDKQLELF